MAKQYPVVRSSNLSNNTGVPQNDRIIQVDQMLSKLNRRLYRMGRFYEVKVDIDTTFPTAIEVFALRDDWAVHKAFQVAYDAYLKNVAEEREALNGQVARWNDFRVQTGVAGADLVDPLLYDVSGTPAALTSGEFALALVADEAGTLRSFTWGAGAANRYGILEEYDKAGNAQASPDSATGDMPYAGLDTEMDANIASNEQAANNLPPYDQNGVNTATPFVKIAELGVTAGGAQRLSTGFFSAPCGIVVLRGVGAATNDPKISFTAKKGDYKGVHAPSMLE